MDEPFACEIGTKLWELYRFRHPEAPEVPPECAEDHPDAAAYWLHASTCLDCNEV